MSRETWWGRGQPIERSKGQPFLGGPFRSNAGFGSKELKVLCTFYSLLPKDQ